MSPAGTLARRSRPHRPRNLARTDTSIAGSAADQNLSTEGPDASPLTCESTLRERGNKPAIPHPAYWYIISP